MRKKKWLLGAAVLVLAGGAFWYHGRSVQARPAGETRIVSVDRGPVRRIVMASGKISANFEVDIKCKASGEVINLPYDVSDIVKKGTLVLELDPIDEQRRVDQQQANLVAAECRLTRAQQTLQISQQKLLTDTRQADITLRSAQITARDLRAKADRLAELIKQKLVSVEDAESAEASAAKADSAVDEAKNAIEVLKTLPISIEMDRNEVKLAETAVLTAKNDLADAQQRLKETKVNAPIDGVVTTRPAQIGTIVSSGITNVGGGSSIMTLCDLSRLFVLAPVNEADIGKVKLDQPVVIRCDAYPDKKFDGKVIRIAAKGTILNTVVTFEVKIEVLGEGKELLRPEMTTDIEVVIAERKNAVRLPSEAVLSRGKDADKKYYVLIPSPQSATAPVTRPASSPAPQGKVATVEHPVEVGVDDGAFCEIISGLSEGDKVAIESNRSSSWDKLKANNGFED